MTKNIWLIRSYFTSYITYNSPRLYGHRIKALSHKTICILERLDILVNISDISSLLKISLNETERILDKLNLINIDGNYNLCDFVIKYLKYKSGEGNEGSIGKKSIF